jgi:NAD-dependent dihydropyrimidine dehydrogenase PreA subunit
MADRIEAETAEAFGRTFVKGNIPEINDVRCLACGNCVQLCRKLGPDVLEIVDGVARPVRPEDCIGDGACMLSCPTKAIFLMSKHDPDAPPEPV